MESKENVYETPVLEIVEIEIEQSVLQSSFIPSDGNWE